MKEANQYLSKKCLEINNKNKSTYICSSINLNRYKPMKKYENNNPVNVGWTGTFSTKIYLKVIEPVIQKISKIRDINFIVIGDFNSNDVELYVRRSIAGYLWDWLKDSANLV